MFSDDHPSSSAHTQQPKTSFVFKSSRYRSRHQRQDSLSLELLEQHADGAVEARRASTPLPEGFVSLVSSRSPNDWPTSFVGTYDPVPSPEYPLFIPPASLTLPSLRSSPASSPTLFYDSSSSYFSSRASSSSSTNSASGATSSPATSISSLPRTPGRPATTELSLTQLVSFPAPLGRPRRFDLQGKRIGTLSATTDRRKKGFNALDQSPAKVVEVQNDVEVMKPTFNLHKPPPIKSQHVPVLDSQ